MAITLVDSDAAGFADGNGGHAYSFPAGAPSVGDHDVLCINSNTVVSTPSGFTLRVDATDQQGAYVFTRKAAGGEASSTTITTSGNHNTDLIWARISGADAFSVGGFTRANNSNDTVLPATSTGALAATGMAVFAFAALHNHDGALAASPVWGNSFTGAEAVTQGSAGASDAVAAFVGYKLNVGTGSETIDSVSWTNVVRNRYALWVAFTATGGTDATATPATIAVVASLPAVTLSAGSTPTPAAIAAVVTLPAVTTSAGSTPIPATIAATVALPPPATSAGSTAAPSTIPVTATLPAVTTTAGGTATPSTVATTVTLPAATLSASSTATPATIAVTVTMPAPTLFSSLRDLTVRLGRLAAKWIVGPVRAKWFGGPPRT